jgi:hypothetical protein
MGPADPILGLNDAYNKDTDARKMNLGPPRPGPAPPRLPPLAAETVPSPRWCRQRVGSAHARAAAAFPARGPPRAGSLAAVGA